MLHGPSRRLGSYKVLRGNAPGCYPTRGSGMGVDQGPFFAGQGLARHREEFADSYWARRGGATHRRSQGMGAMFR
jgi:hypothetical protein